MMEKEETPMLYQLLMNSLLFNIITSHLDWKSLLTLFRTIDLQLIDSAINLDLKKLYRNHNEKMKREILEISKLYVDSQIERAIYSRIRYYIVLSVNYLSFFL